MGKVPNPRKPGQTGGAGGHGRNMHNAQKRDMSGAKKDGCALAALGLVGAGAALLTGLGWGAVELVQALA